MSLIKTISLVVGTTLFLGGAVAVIGWIGFQEHFRLLTQSFRTREVSQPAVETGAEPAQGSRVVETVAEATVLIEAIETQLSSLEEDGLPAEGQGSDGP